MKEDKVEYEREERSKFEEKKKEKKRKTEKHTFVRIFIYC